MMKMMKRVLSVLLALCLLTGLCTVPAAAKGINRYVPVLQALINERNSLPYAKYAGNYGLYYDINGDGIEELLVVRAQKNKQFPSVLDRVACLYTIVDGEAQALLTDQQLYVDAGGPSGYWAVVEKDGKLYAAAVRESGGTSPDGRKRNGSWTLYTINPLTDKLVAAHTVTYNYYISFDKIYYDRSSAVINGKNVSYKEFETWKKSLKVKATTGSGFNDCITFEALLRQAQADQTGDLPITSVAGFKDVKVSAYYADAVQWAVTKGITSGKTPTSFGTGKTCTRSEIVTLLWNAYDKPEPTSFDNPFTDVKSTDFFYKAVLWAREKGITSGATATTFGSKDPCTREQAMTFIWNAAGKPTASGGNSFGDVLPGKYYEQAVNWAVENHITNGKTPTSFGTGQSCPREQIVTFLYNHMGK